MTARFRPWRRALAGVAIGVGLSLGAVPAAHAAAEVSTADQHRIAKVYRATVKCDIVNYQTGSTVYQEEGSGTGSTRTSAELNAKKHVDTKVPAGHYKRHCRIIAKNW